jgi:RNA polymerase sigma-70 factor (ECF subfamily)
MEGRPTGVAEDETGERASSFEAFFGAERARLFGTLCLIAGDRSEAEELMQEAFLRVWERWDRVSELENPTGYLYRTAFNAFRSRLRRAVRATRRVVASADPADPFPGIDDRHDLLDALRSLPTRQRVAVVLTELTDLSSEEAGEILGIKPVTVRVLASQGRSALRRRLEAADG